MTTQAPAGFFSGTNGLDSSNSLPHFPDGFVGRVRVDRCKGILPLKGGKAFIAEVTVLTSNLDAIKPGGKYSWYQGINGKFVQTAYASCIGFLYACLGLVPGRDQAVIDAEIKPCQDKYLNDAVDEVKNPLGGAEVMLQTSVKDKKHSEGQYTIHNWTAVPPAPAQQAAA